MDVTTREVDVITTFDLTKVIGTAVDASGADQATALAALLIVSFIVARRGYPVVEENLKPFVRDVSTFIHTYELPVKHADATLPSADPIPAPPPVTVN